MKSKLLIICFLILCFAIPARSQNTVKLGIKEGYIATVKPAIDSTQNGLIADETWLTYTKTGAKIVTYSEAVFKAISLEFGEEFKAIHIYYKNDRNGPYKEYVILVGYETGIKIKIWSIKNL